MEVDTRTNLHYGLIADSAKTSRAILCKCRVLSKCICLCSAELLPAEFAHFAFTSLSVLFRTHLHIILRKASLLVDCEEATVAPIKDVDVRESELRITEIIDSTVTPSYEFSTA